MEEQRATGNTYEFNSKDFLNSFIGVMKTVLVKPKDFYQNMPVTGGFSPPFVFLAICLGVSGILAAIIAGVDVFLFLKLVIFGAIFSFIGAGILHLIAQQFFEGKGAYEGVYRTVAYAGVVNLLTWIPVVGFLAGLYGLYLQIVGLEKVHKITAGQAVVTVLIAFAIYLIFGLVVGGVFFGIRF
ncbi:MAG: YIP1 family protein [Desulfobacterales bacterium]|nr:YIP1 family protein [Desulfobacterales bacterium]